LPGGNGCACKGRQVGPLPRFNALKRWSNFSQRAGLPIARGTGNHFDFAFSFMRSAVPSAASQPTALPSSKAQLPSVRSQNDGGAPATPFAALLDGATTAENASSTPQPTRNASSERQTARDASSAQPKERADQSDRGDAAAAAEDAKIAAGAIAKDSTQANDGQADEDADLGETLIGIGEAKAGKNGKDAAATKVASAAMDIPESGDATETAPAVDESGERTPAGDDAAAAAIAAIDTAAAPASRPAEVATAVAAGEATPEPELAAAAPTAGKRVATDNVNKPAPAPTEDTGEPESPALKTGEHGKDHERHAASEKPAGNARLAATDAQPKASADAPSQAPVDAAASAKTGGQTVQHIGVVTPGAHSNAAAATAAAAATPAANAATPAAVVPVAGLAVEIAAQAQAGKHRFEIRLDPPELGRIDVRLEVDRDGHVSSRLVIDRSETLDLLKRDAAQLERALQQAGLKTSDSALEFTLRQQTSPHDEAGTQGAATVNVPDDDPAPLEALRQGYGRLLGLGGGLDIRV
jgi:flagellar hook-length control protein FliK